MIQSFSSKNKIAEAIFNKLTVKSFPMELHKTTYKKLIMLHVAQDLQFLKVPPSNRLEKLKGDKKDYYSIRINDKYRIVFKWKPGMASNVLIEDYH